MARRCSPFLALVPSLVLALAGGCAEVAGEEALAEGEAVVPGAADEAGASVVYASATTVGPLLYSYFESTRERERSDESLRAIFEERIEPASSAGEPWRYLRRMSALGFYGPIGPYGPLGILGPLGDDAWSAEHYVTGGFAWADWSEELTRAGGPLSEEGPLGSEGPLSPAYEPAHEEVSAFVSHLRPGGIFALLGPIGALGALGPLGPLGPAGAHGYARADGGEYWPEEGELCHDAPAGYEAPPCRRIDVLWEAGGETRTYELVERYDEDYAQALGDNDTSFVVDGTITGDGEVDEYAFTSSSSQWVSVLVIPVYARYPFVQAMSVLGQAAALDYEVPRSVFVPHVLTGFPVPNGYDHESSFDDFDIELDVSAPSARGTVASRAWGTVDWIHVRVPRGTEMRLRVSAYSTWYARAEDAWWGLPPRAVPAEYRVVVVGSTEHGQGSTTFSGPYLRALEGTES